MSRIKDIGFVETTKSKATHIRVRKLSTTVGTPDTMIVKNTKINRIRYATSILSYITKEDS